ncbi:MAG: hypothetical protein H8D82_01015 [Euryarchaeota archaeon]|nr:hypothetical protein [Euryarchaeota archaeon]
MVGGGAQDMDLVGVLESLSTLTCGGALIIWMSIGTLSRTEKGELIAQKAMTFLCFTAAFSLFALYFAGGALFGSANFARVLAVVCIAVGVSASMNIKGKDVQGESNPHDLMKLKKQERESQESE